MLLILILYSIICFSNPGLKLVKFFISNLISGSVSLSNFDCNLNKFFILINFFLYYDIDVIIETNHFADFFINQNFFSAISNFSIDFIFFLAISNLFFS